MYSNNSLNKYTFVVMSGGQSVVKIVIYIYICNKVLLLIR